MLFAQRSEIEFHLNIFARASVKDRCVLISMDQVWLRIDITITKKLACIDTRVVYYSIIPFVQRLQRFSISSLSLS